ncbi:MAG: hypothetical protein GC131_00570 [Alphaproteobacteria bacterium]|nr:hypothetical protein [Alphaproteobacteria bacterium]
MKNEQSHVGDQVISLADLKAKRKELEDAIFEIDEAIDAFENILECGYFAGRNSLILSAGLAPKNANQTSNIVPTNIQNDYENLSIYEAAVKVLSKENQPLTTNELVDKIVAGGKKVEGKDTRVIVATTLYKSVRKKKNCKIALAGKGLWTIAP